MNFVCLIGLCQVSAPLLILHGAADKVTDPLVSKFLYENASSKDKTLKLYENGYHCILEGEPDDRIKAVHDDIVSWLDSRCLVKWDFSMEYFLHLSKSFLE